jgi:hypothetical protein
VVTVADDSQYATQLLIAAHLVRVLHLSLQVRQVRQVLVQFRIINNRLFAPPPLLRVPRGSRMRRCGPSARAIANEVSENQRPPQTETSIPVAHGLPARRRIKMQIQPKNR